MPRVSDFSDKLNNDFPNDDLGDLEDIQLRDFSDDMDLGGLADLLEADSFGGASQSKPTREDIAQQAPDLEPISALPRQEPPKQKKNTGGGLGKIFGAGKVRASKKKNKRPSEKEAHSEDKQTDTKAALPDDDLGEPDIAYLPYADDGLPFSEQEPVQEAFPGVDHAAPLEDFASLDNSSPLEEFASLGDFSPFESGTEIDKGAENASEEPFDASEIPHTPPAADVGEDAAPSEMSWNDLYEQTFGQDFALPQSGQSDTKKKEKKSVGNKVALPALGAAFAALGASVAGSVQSLTARLGLRFAKGVGKKASAPLTFGDDLSDDPNYISDTVSLVDIPSPDDEKPDVTAGTGFAEAADSAAINKTDLFSDDFADGISDTLPNVDRASFSPSLPQEPFSEDAAYGAYRTEEGYEGDDSQSGNTADVISSESLMQEEPSEPVRQKRRTILDDFADKLVELRRRLPSFKPKVYTIPEPNYEPMDDHIKSPTLVADIERYIARETDLGETQTEYDRMRDFIRTVSTDVKLTSEELRAPENLHQVYAAESELFDLIDEIGRRNEEQRGRIGMYDAPPEQDPYNYRGINDERQNYADIEVATFSMQPRLDFESERKIDPHRPTASAQDPLNGLGNQSVSEPSFNGLGGQSLSESSFNSLDRQSVLESPFNSLGEQTIPNMNASISEPLVDIPSSQRFARSTGRASGTNRAEEDSRGKSGSRNEKAVPPYRKKAEPKASPQDEWDDDLGDIEETYPMPRGIRSGRKAPPQDEWDDDLGDIEETYPMPRGTRSGRKAPPQDEWDDDLGDIEEDRAPLRGTHDTPYGRNGYDDELAEDFDSHFDSRAKSPRTMPSSSERRPKKVAVRRR